MNKNKTMKPTIADHIQTPDGENHAVGVFNLHVILTPDCNSWFAQGLEIDYASQGETIEEAKKNFEIGFKSTIHAHIQMFGSIEKLLKLAPAEVWKEMSKVPASQWKGYSHTSFHNLMTMPIGMPYEGISFTISETNAKECMTA